MKQIGLFLEDFRKPKKVETLSNTFETIKKNFIKNLFIYFFKIIKKNIELILTHRIELFLFHCFFDRKIITLSGKFEEEPAYCSSSLHLLLFFDFWFFIFTFI